MKKDAYYFSHDANSRNDVKCVKLRREMGMEGYGIFWSIIEILREATDYQLQKSCIDDIAFSLHVTPEKVTRIITDFELFETTDQLFWSPRLCSSMEEYNQLKTKLQEAGQKGGYSKAKARLKPGSSIKVNKMKEKERDVFPSGMIL